MSLKAVFILLLLLMLVPYIDTPISSHGTIGYKESEWILIEAIETQFWCAIIYILEQMWKLAFWN